MHNHCINKLLNLKEVNVKNIIHGDSYVKIYLQTTPKEQKCPNCGLSTKRIHDYRTQTIKDLPFQEKDCYLVLKKRRYRCSCGKRFLEKYDFLARYQQRSIRLTHAIANKLRDSVPLTYVAKQTNVSTSTVSRILDTISYSCPPLKDAFAIDEFKGNADTGKYQCIIVNPKQHTVMDILPDRTNSHLSAYFRELDRSQRYRVKFFICDMWQPYVDIAHTYFPNAKVIIDKYHFIRQVTWTIESVRKRLQKSLRFNVALQQRSKESTYAKRMVLSNLPN